MDSQDQGYGPLLLIIRGNMGKSPESSSTSATGVPEREWLASQGQKSRIELRSFHSQLLFQSSAERKTRKWPMVEKMDKRDRRLL
jgi:hypothetical protein